MSSVGDASMGHFQVAVARMQLDAVEQEGRDALNLIAAAQPPTDAAPQNVQPGVATQLNVVA